MAHNLTYPLILASGSPRRRQLLQDAGYNFTVVPPLVDEPLPSQPCGQAGSIWAEALAYIKAASVALTHPQAVVIGADTIVVHGDTLVGKPSDREDARRILTSLFGGENRVITGLAVLCPEAGFRMVTHVCTTLIMRPMDPRELKDYLDSGAWQDKAGAYALQEGGDRFVQSIHGSQSNIVGLPMEKLQEALAGFKTFVADGYCG